MKLSVIIPCFNAASTIAVQLEALANQQWSEPWEVIVSNNGSTDETVAISQQYKEKLPNLRIVDASDRRGAAHARNVGALAATGDALAFCDADDEIASGWVAAMGEALAKYDFVAGKRDYKKLNILPSNFSLPSQQDGLQKKLSFLPYAPSCNLGVKRSIHEAIGGFDETLLRAQDVDYCWRIQLAGTKLHFLPDIVVQYRFRPTVAESYKQAFLWAKYDVLLYKKYRSLGMPNASYKQGVKAWINLLRRFPQIFSQTERTRWIVGFARSLGQLYGSIQYRVLVLYSGRQGD